MATPQQFRQTREWSLERLCEELGLAPGSKGHLSRLERGELPWPTDLALKMQLISGSEVLARDLIPEDKRELLDQLTAGAPEGAGHP